MLTRRSLAAAGITIALVAGLVALPACGKKKNTDSGSPAPGPNPPVGGPNSGAPRGGLGLSRSNTALLRSSQNNLKQIGLAFHNYHDTYQSFPAGIYGPDGKSAGLSWRVQILPFIEQANLYRQFKLNESWDSPHNKSLIGMRPKQFAPPGGFSPEGQTYYRAFSGPGTVMPPPGAAGVPGTPIRGLRLQSIQDGTSTTGLVAEAGEPVIWTKPDEMVFDPKGPMPTLGGVFSEGTNLVLCDGAVYFLPISTPPEKWRALSTTGGNEIIDLP